MACSSTSIAEDRFVDAMICEQDRMEGRWGRGKETVAASSAAAELP